MHNYRSGKRLECSPGAVSWLGIVSILAVVIALAIGYGLISCQGKIPVVVESFSPDGEIDQTTNITIEFSQNIVDENSIEKQLDTAPVVFMPEIPGKYKWIARNKLRFFPEVVLPPSTQYTVEVLPEICTGAKNYLKGERKFTFNTERLRVDNSYFSFMGVDPVGRTVSITGALEFNCPVKVEDLKKHLTISYEDGPSIPYEIITQESGLAIELETDPIERGDSDKKVQLRINQNLLPIRGNLALSEDYLETITLRAEEELKVEGAFPEQAGTYGYVKVRFSAPVAIDMARQHITVDPAVVDQVISNRDYIELKGNFQAEKAYTINISKGLMGIDGSELKSNFSTKVVMQNLQPSIGFVGDGIYLSRTGNLNVGLTTINMEKVEIEVQKVYLNNLVYLLHTGSVGEDRGWYDLSDLGKVIHTEEIFITQRVNEEVITPINMKSYLEDERTGIFAVVARNVDRRWHYSTRWVMITDLGISVKHSGDDFLIWLNSLSSLNPISGAEVTLISQNNQVMKTALTGEDGVAALQVTGSAAEEFSPFLITASHGEDMSFLELWPRQIATTDFDVEGQPYLRAGYDAFVYGDRDIYRPGEKVHLVVIVRGPNASVPPSFPLKMQILGPDNRIFEEFSMRTNNEGACEFEADIPPYAKTGYYTARAMVGKDSEIGRGGFSVEEFMPDRIKVKVGTDSEAYSLGQDVKVQVEALNLFGPPASGRRAEAEAEVVASQFSPAKWRSFTFSDPHKQFTSISASLGQAVLDAQGKYTFTYKLPMGLLPPSTLSGIFSVTVHEPGGRAITGYRTVDIHPYSHYVGLRRMKDGYADVGKPTEMEFVVADKEGEAVSGRKCEVSCYRIVWQSILRREGRYGYRYVSERQDSPEKSFTVESGPGPVRIAFTPDDYGEYRIEVRDLDAASTASIEFYASGWGYAPWAMDKPERLEIDLEKTSYKPGETAKAQIKSPFSGKLLLTVEGDKVYSHRTMMMDENTATVNIPVLADYKPNVYISASVIRSTLSLERHAPVRAFGVVPLTLDCGENKMNITLDVPSEMRPLKPLTVSFQVKGKNKGGNITIAAVDEGICQLTDFQTPDPFGQFFGKKRLEVTSHDIYSAVLPEVEMARSPSSASGGMERRRISPVSVTRVKPVALWSGLVEVDGDGKGSVTFDVPQFNGSLRIMAVSFSGDTFGSAQGEVKVFDPIVLTPTFPRFIAGGDTFQVPVTVFNGTGKAGQFAVTLDIDGPVEKPKTDTQTLDLAPKAEGQIIFPLKAKDLMGKVSFILSAVGGGAETSITTDVPLRPAAPAITLTGSGVVKPGIEERFSFPGGWVPETTEFELAISSFPAMQFAGSLQYLLRYPYGCAEQTTSRVFPLLYFNDLVKVVEPELFKTQSADYFINEGIKKLENMQLRSGEFAFWPGGGYGNPWTSVYVSHFMVEAKKAGYEISERVYNNMIRILKDYVRSTSLDDWQRQTRVYACYVLALAGQPEKSTMLYLKNNELIRMSDYSHFQLAGAFAFTGDMNTARWLLPETVTPREVKRESGMNFNSSTRAKAIMLDILAEVNPDHPSVPKLVKSLADSASKGSHWYTTQDNAFAFLALGKLLRKQPPGQYTGKVKIGGAHLADFDSGDHRFTDVDWSGKEVTLNIQGTGTCYYYWTVFGVPVKPDIEKFDHELTVRRRYLDRNGKEITGNQFHQGDMIVTEITARALTEDMDNVVISDLLPAGFEIENPRLESRAGIPWIRDVNYRPDYMDIRDDRMLLFVTLPRQQERKFYYASRAVTVGDFVLPSIAAEAMYDPAKSSISGGGRVKVVE